MTWIQSSPGRPDHDTNVAAVLASLWSWNYPFTGQWVPYLKDCHLSLTADWAAWFQPVGDATVELHVCAAPDRRCRWLSRPVIAGLIGQAVMAGADRIIANPVHLNHERQLQRLGFVRVTGTTYLLNTDGHTQNPSTEGGGTCPARPSGSAREGGAEHRGRPR